MSKVNQHPKLTLLQKRDRPINYSLLSVDKSGALQERSSLLDQRIVEGYAVTWGSRNDYGEVFVKGCFAKSIADNGPGSGSNYEIKFRDRHGKTCALFEVIKEDEIGLYFRTKPLDNVSWCDDLLVQIRSGSINNFSIGFKHVWDKIEWDDENDSMINLEARLFEMSAVDIPSDMSSYAIRSMEEPEFLIDDVEDFITKLPRSVRLEARKIFTRCMSLSNEEPNVRNAISLESKKPAKSGLDLNYLISKL